MNKQAQKYPYLKNTSPNLACTVLDSLRPKSPINNARYILCNSPHRQNSPNPHLKVKIRLVSPHRIMNATSFVRKQNNPPIQTDKSQKYQDHLKSPLIDGYCMRHNPVRYIAQVKLNQQSRLSIVNHFEKQSKSTSPMHSLFKTTRIHDDSSPNRQLDQSCQPFSPQRVELNNTCFDLVNRKSQIIYENPMNQKRGWNKGNKIQVQRRVHTEQSTAYNYSHPSNNLNNLHSDLFIQEQDNLQEFKLSYEQEIKTQQMQTKIQQNSIKPLLHHSRLSKHTTISNVVQNYQFVDDPQVVPSNNTPQLSKEKNCNEQQIVIQQTFTKKVPICSQQTIINELDIITSKRIQKRQNQQYKVNKDQVSENEEIESNNLESKIHRLSLIRNQQCSIQMIIKAEQTPQKQQTTTIPSFKQSKDCDKNNDEKVVNVCSQPSLIYHIQKPESSSLQSISFQKSAQQKSISVKSKESKAGSIVSQKIEPKEQKKRIIAQEKIIEDIRNNQILQAPLTLSKKSPHEDQTPFIRSVPSPKPKIQISRDLPLQSSQPAPTAHRKFNNRAYL